MAASEAEGRAEALRRIAACRSAQSDELDLGGLQLTTLDGELLTALCELGSLRQLFLGLSAEAREKPQLLWINGEKNLMVCNALGVLPAALFDGLTRLEQLDLARNQLRGVPASIANLASPHQPQPLLQPDRGRGGAGAQGPRQPRQPRPVRQRDRGRGGAGAQGPRQPHQPQPGRQPDRGRGGAGAQGPRQPHQPQPGLQPDRGRGGAGAQGPRQPHQPQPGLQPDRGRGGAGAQGPRQPHQP